MANPLVSIRTLGPPLERAQDHDRMEFNRGSRWLMAFGAAIALVALVRCAASIARGLQDESGAASALLPELAGGALFIGVGLVLVFGRYGHILDRREGTAVTRWALLGVQKTRERRLADFDRVVLDKRIVRSSKSSYEVFPVELQGSGPELTLLQPRRYEPARRQAEAVADFLGLRLLDSTAGEGCVREAGRLDESLRDRALRAGEPVEWPELPEGSLIEYRTEGDEAIIELPLSRAAGAKRALHIALALVGVEVGVFLLLPLLVPGIPTSFRALGLALGVLGAFAVATVLMLKPGPPAQGQRERIVVSARELRGENSIFGRAGAWVIPADELEELIVEPHVEHPLMSLLGVFGGLVARSDRRTVHFAGSLSPAECNWLHGVIRYIIIDDAAGKPENVCK